MEQHQWLRQPDEHAFGASVHLHISFGSNSCEVEILYECVYGELFCRMVELGQMAAGNRLDGSEW